MALSARAPRVGDPFWDLLVRDARAWGVDPREVAFVMMAESGVDPGALNFNPKKPEAGAAGMNQITNFDNFAPLTRDAYLALDAASQWNLAVWKYFNGQIKAHPGVIEGGARDLYWINFVPATYKANAPDDYIYVEPSGHYGNLTGQQIIDGNLGLVLPSDSANPVLRPAGLTAFMVRQSSGKNASRWAEVLGAIGAAEKGAGMVLNGPATQPGNHQVTPTTPKVAQASMAGPAVVLGLFGLWAWARSRRGKR